MFETILIAIATEVVVFAVGAILTIPAIKKELQILNKNMEISNETLAALVETVIRDDEKLENHINNKHIHNMN